MNNNRIVKIGLHQLKIKLERNPSLKYLLYLLAFACSGIILAPIIANDKPLVCKYKNNWLFPAFSLKHEIKISKNEIINYEMGNDWKYLVNEYCIFPLIAYSPQTIDVQNSLQSPFEKQKNVITEIKNIQIPLNFRHWLGTTQNGTDVLSGMIHGAKTSLLVGFWSMLISGIVGVLFGALAGYYGNTTFKIRYVQLLMIILSILLSLFYDVMLIEYSDLVSIDSYFWIAIIIIVSFLTVLLFSKLGKQLDVFIGSSKQISIPIDVIITKIIEVLNSVPSLLLIIAIVAISTPTYVLLVMMIGLLSWTTVARLTRAEFMKAKELNYVKAYITMGMKPMQIMVCKILPNIFPLIFVQLLFIFSMAILMEASLSFIGIAVPNNSISWGALMAEARENFSAWWLVVFPGGCIFFVTYFIHKIQKKFRINDTTYMVR